ncbi:hypothetical protein bcCo53_001160 (plasmid) [Borrelia coriaceae]|uniref:Antigen P35 n=1 Tax=Borrelia coriaceae ATCC 43381 TaxID=1408429 RepID=W5T1J4_9SPIR|nr:hypothetical protein [Borrelia coriaceae]AHH11131.1 hypothetical protein BCO_0023400 [Borrelia coriaceae ATCC 43381]UPA16992.1 hypothetical protein bcCo53_001160 [Borrelia coriaceae]
MKKFNIVFFLFGIFLSLFVITCKPSATHQTTTERTSKPKVKGEVVGSLVGLLDKATPPGEVTGKGDNVVPAGEQVNVDTLCPGEVLAPFPSPLPESELEERDKAYKQFSNNVARYTEQLANETKKFESLISQGKVQIITGSGDGGSDQKELLKTHFHKVSTEFINPALVQNIRASLGYDIQAIRRLEEIIDSLRLDEISVGGDQASKKVIRDQLLDLSYNLLFLLSQITLSAVRLTGEYLHESRLAKLARSKFTQKLVELNNHLNEFIQVREQFIEKIKKLILDVKIGDVQNMLTLLKNITDEKSDIVAAANFTERKATIIRCAVDNLRRVVDL